MRSQGTQPAFHLAGMLVALFAFVLSLICSIRYFERLPHIEDEIAYVWQARVIAESGKLTTPTPPCPKCFLVPFVVDAGGHRSGKYPPGWPAALAIGEYFHARDLVNPLLAGLSIWLIYRLGSKIFDPRTGLLAAVLTTLSPFFLMNSASLLSHAWSLFLSLAFTIAWLDLFGKERRIHPGFPLATTVLCISALALTRPLTAVGIAIPFGFHALFVLIRGTRAQRSYLLAFGLLSAALSSTYFLWQFVVTGDLFSNPYTLWWPYDKIGFGPGIGVNPQGHTLQKALFHTDFSMNVGRHDLFGWPYLSYLFVPFGIWAGRRKLGAWLSTGIIACLIGAYMLYWTPAWLFGPRYYFEALPGAALLSAAGIFWLAGSFSRRPLRLDLARLRFGLVWLIFGVLFAGNILFYLPLRMSMMSGLYNVAGADLAPFQTSDALSMPPTLVIVSVNQDWIEYGRLLDLASPMLDSQFIFIISRGPTEEVKVMHAFPDRQVWYYTPPAN